ncbi:MULTISPECIES: ABC transporter ATP-binding protein [unclassified Colwellia]|uniref:ABC transporter ATP-binding protein n=1 Tax=unclassified Colwellia TaxID=196834 RepID=UPI0015F749A9|nr:MULTISPECIES: ABC transporter ATP-binding protein [unclassified Colwellia]MBA6234193.1 ABC transporter ATP-binding protein [Colwellia sp. MB02u-7]MBA6237796.1 ABC transporter ATP-binding protein [Colwellia sp. MB02u-11]MBA6254851.1 ABC transporter ATP-binding protein [Colwellia sp. MB3u-28]MBA6259831.1 ABC transporter ATP-binding protein [Colwellia sp. MB3u-41]MBA6300953.1 ABC transporter ATP-binding protein [Colwellia sp. MB3u-22]
MIEVKNLCFSRSDGENKENILNQLNLSVPAGQHLALLGDSGSGKTTLLHVLAGLLQADSGSVSVNDQELSSLDEKQLTLYRRKIGLIFQHYQLLDCLTVKQNILFQHKLNFPKQDANEFDHLVAELGLQDKLNALPHQLSGGEQQRVGIARALLNKPQIIFADEPTGNLDRKRSHQVVKLLTQLCSARKINLVMVTHSHQLTDYFDHVKVLRDGRFD